MPPETNRHDNSSETNWPRYANESWPHHLPTERFIVVTVSNTEHGLLCEAVARIYASIT